MTQTELNLSGPALRNRGIAQVLARPVNQDWCERALILLSTTVIGYTSEINSDEIRQMVENRIGKPTHPNAWGAMVRTACKHGILSDTGRTVHSTNPVMRARRIPVWTWNTP